MELISSTLAAKHHESETETQPPKTSPFSNGVLKIHAPPHRHHHHHPVVITYKECLKNHAAALGGHAVDGCGEFMPSPTSNPNEPTSLKCAACGCHRNFHRREPDEPVLLLPTIEFRPHHRHHPPPPHSPDNSPSPPPISSAYHPSALLALHNSTAAAINAASLNLPSPSPNGSRKRFRTRFSQGQKVKMLELAERLGWKMQKKDEDVINEVCSEIGVEKGVFKVWMHNNKSGSSKKDNNIAISTPPALANHGNGVSYGVSDDSKHINVDRRENDNVGNHGSSSST